MMFTVRMNTYTWVTMLGMCFGACGNDVTHLTNDHDTNCPAGNDSDDPRDFRGEEVMTCPSYWRISGVDSDSDAVKNSGVNDVPVNRHLNPGCPTYVSAGEATKCNDGAYGVDYWGIGTQKNNAWSASSPASCALDLENTAASEILVGLSDENGTGNIEGWPGFRNYIVSTSADSTDGTDGSWQPQVSVTRNSYGYRIHRIPFSGQRWLKVTVRSPSTAVIDELDVWDVSDEPDELSSSIIWVGDSITARCADRHGTYGARPSFQKIIQRNFAPHYPLQIGAGTVGLNTTRLLDGNPSTLQSLLATYPDVRFWGVLLGTNESKGEMNSAEFHANLTRIVEEIEAEGHQPIIAKMPYTTSKSHSRATERLNAVIEAVTIEKHLTPGPDLYQLFKRNADRFYSDGDKIHPNKVGCTAWQQAWVDTIGPLLN